MITIGAAKHLLRIGEDKLNDIVTMLRRCTRPIDAIRVTCNKKQMESYVGVDDPNELRFRLVKMLSKFFPICVSLPLFKEEHGIEIPIRTPKDVQDAVNNLVSLGLDLKYIFNITINEPWHYKWKPVEADMVLRLYKREIERQRNDGIYIPILRPIPPTNEPKDFRPWFDTGYLGTTDLLDIHVYRRLTIENGVIVGDGPEGMKNWWKKGFEIIRNYRERIRCSECNTYRYIRTQSGELKEYWGPSTKEYEQWQLIMILGMYFATGFQCIHKAVGWGPGGWGLYHIEGMASNTPELLGFEEGPLPE